MFALLLQYLKNLNSSQVLKTNLCVDTKDTKSRSRYLNIHNQKSVITHYFQHEITINLIKQGQQHQSSAFFPTIVMMKKY